MGYFGMFQNLAQALGPAIGLAIYGAAGFAWLCAASAGLALLALLLALTLNDGFVPQPKARLAWSSFFTAKAMRPTLLVMGMAFATGSIMSFVPLYGASQGISNPGFFFTLYAAAMFVCRPLSGTLSDRLGRMPVVVPGMFIITSGLLLLAAVPGWWPLLASAGLLGVGLGTVFPALLALMLDLTGPAERGAAMSTFGIGMDIGIGLGSILLGVIIEASGFGVAFTVAGLVPVVFLALYATSTRLWPPTRAGLLTH